MQACDAMVLATPCETFGLVVIEAMSVGTPMVATNACGPLEIIDDQESGLLFEKSSSEGLADKIEMLRSSDILCSSISKRALFKIQDKFSNDKQFEKLTTVFKGLF